ncbi:MAG: TonB family protein [Pantoea sp.]|uniref:TonB family protein n=1 Tax=Pantoea TaxID=53335 RepID=UPI0028AF4849|nr:MULTISPECIES: TonB family protein [Pantoea]MDU1575437.1 TonB family protein [Pantoea sp.]
MLKFIFPMIFMMSAFSAEANVIKYPARAENLRIGGEVNVLYDINKSGRVENVRLTKAEPLYVFERSVRKQMSYWKFPIGEARKDEKLKILFKAN